MVNEQTLQAYKEAGAEYQYRGIDEHLRNERDKTSNDTNKTRKINSMYRFRTNESQEYLLYEQDIITISNVTKNRIQWHEDFGETSMYFVPIVERQFRYDQETEKQSSEIRQIASVETRYTIPFTEEEVNKIKPFANLTTKYYVWQQDGLMSAINDFNDWLKIPFEVLIAGPDTIHNYKLEQEEKGEDDTTTTTTTTTQNGEEPVVQPQVQQPQPQPQPQQQKVKVSK